MEINGKTIPRYDHCGPEWEKAMLDLDKKAIIQILKTKGKEADQLAEDKKRLDWLEDHLNAGVGRDQSLRIVGDGITEIARASTLREALDLTIGLEGGEAAAEIERVVVGEGHKPEAPSECSECGDFFVPKSEEDTKCDECRQQEAEEAHDDGECVENCPVCAEEREVAEPER